MRGSPFFVYGKQRPLDGKTLDFEFKDEVLTDTGTGSQWNQFGQCVSGEMEGTQLAVLQSYQQYVRAWLSFHVHSDFYDFSGVGK